MHVGRLSILAAHVHVNLLDRSVFATNQVIATFAALGKPGAVELGLESWSKSFAMRTVARPSFESPLSFSSPGLATGYTHMHPVGMPCLERYGVPSICHEGLAASRVSPPNC